MLRRGLLIALLRPVLAEDTGILSLLGLVKEQFDSEAAAAASTFRAGDLVEALDAEDESWVPGTVVGLGSKPGTYSLAVPEVGVVSDVSDKSLRMADTYQAGDTVEALDATNGGWFPCSITSANTQARTYDLSNPIAGMLTDVPAFYLRRANAWKAGDVAEVMDLTTSLWAPCSIIKEDSPGIFEISAEDVPESYTVHSLMLRSLWRPKAGLEVQVLVQATQQWVVGTVMEPGSKPNTYVVSVTGAEPVLDVPRVALRRVVKPKTTFMGEILHPAQMVQFLDRHTGNWVPGFVQGNGTQPDTYDLEVPSLGRIYDMSIIAMRRMPKIAEGEVVEVLDIPRGLWMRGQLIGEGIMPYTFDVHIRGLKTYPDVSMVQIRPYVKPREGEVMELYNPKKDKWTVCKIIGEDATPNTYTVYIRKAGQKAGIPGHLFRRLAKPKF